MRNTEENRKILLYASLIFNIFIILICISLYCDLNKITPLQDIKGFYQSVQYLPDVYNYTFTDEEEGEFTINISDSIEEGRYERYKDNIYICYKEEGVELIILLNEGFYIYDDENNRVVKMKKLSDIPTYIIPPDKG